MKVKSENEVVQSCPTLCDPMDCSPPSSSVHGIFQARVLEWVAIAFSKKYFRKLKYPEMLNDLMKTIIQQVSSSCSAQSQSLCLFYLNYDILSTTSCYIKSACLKFVIFFKLAISVYPYFNLCCVVLSRSAVSSSL